MTMHNPAHPGEILKEGWLAPLSISITEASNALAISRKHLSNIVNGKVGVTPEVAKRLHAYTGSSAKMWLNLQVAYDLWQLKDASYNIQPLSKLSERQSI